jgi:16S rRNA (uracil1498-N3)-methyltransferase
LNIDDLCIFFDKQSKIAGTIATADKKRVVIVIQSQEKITPLKPTIIFLLPLLKRDDYETALYALTEIGVNIIQPIFTQKTAHQWNRRDNDRAERILIGAAEQSKNFAYPELADPILLDTALQKYAAAPIKIFFDPLGKPFFEVAQIVHSKNISQLLLLIGPEGDLNAEEKKITHTHGFIFCALTPTIMRATQAASLGAGFIRSLLV